MGEMATNAGQEEPAFPIGIAITHCYDSPLPIDAGEYQIPTSWGEAFTLVVTIEYDQPEQQVLLLLSPGVVLAPETTGHIEERIKVNDDKKVEEYYKYVRDVMTGEVGLRLKTKHSLDIGSFSFGEGDKRIRGILPLEFVAVYETCMEAINTFLLAAKCAFPNRLLFFPQFDEDYVSPVAFNWSKFFYYTPTFKKRIRRLFTWKALIDKLEFENVSREDYEKGIRGILTNPADSVADRMAVSANRCLRDSEYEASILMLQSTFETLVKNSIEDFYENTLSKKEYKKKIESVLYDKSSKGKLVPKKIETLVKKELPACGYQPVPAKVFKEWKESRDRKNEVTHHHKDPVTKEEALQTFWLYDRLTVNLFNRHVWFIGDRQGYLIHFGGEAEE